MHNIFIGLLLVFFDFSLNLGSMHIGLIPDFIGYIYIRKGIMELTEHSEWFSKINNITLGMAIYSGVIYCLDLLGISTSMNNAVITFILGIVSTVVMLYITYGIVMGIKDMETGLGCDLNSSGLIMTWKIYAVCSVIIFFFYFIPGLNILGVIITFIVYIYFLYIFYTSKKSYESIK